MENSISVGTWNIWVFGERDAEAIADLIEENNLDIVGLQEVAKYFDEENTKNMAKEIAEELGYNYCFFTGLDFRPEKPYKMGNAIVSKYPIEDSQRHELNPKNLEYDGSYQTEPRIAVEAEIDAEGKKISFISTHLQYSYKFKSSNIRTKQVQNLISVAGKSDNPTILTGDFNSTPTNEEIKMLEKELERLGDDKPTWTVQPFDHDGWKVEDLEYRLDNIFIDDELVCENTETIYSKISDHLPIKAKIKIKP